MAKRALVCGGRGFTDSDFVYRTLDKLHREHGFDVVIEGDAKGVDRMAGYWARCARLTNIKEAVTDADYREHGRRAPLVRNQRMLDKHRPDLGIAFPGGHGTADMVRRLNAAHVEVIEVRRDKA